MSSLKLDAEQIQLLARIVGVDIDDAQASTLISQAEPHFSLMRALDQFDAGSAEPAGEFRLNHAEDMTNG